MSTAGRTSVLRSKPWLPYAAFGATAAAAVAAAALEHGAETARDDYRLATIVRNVESRVESRIARNAALLDAVTADFTSDQAASESTFRSFMDALDVPRRFSRVRAIGFSRFVPAADGLPPRHVVEFTAPDGEAAASVVGDDLAADPVKRAAMDRSTDLGVAVASGRATFNEAGAAGFVFFAPVYRPGASPRDAAERRAALAGHAFLEFRGEGLLDEVLEPGERDLASFALYADALAVPSALVHRSASAAPDPDARTAAFRFDASGRPWTVVASALPKFDASSDAGNATAILVGGGVLGVALFAACRSSLAAADSSRRVAAELRRADDALRDSERQFREITENIHEVVWVTAADGVTILYISPSYEQVWGRARAALFADPLTWTESIHPEDRARVVAEMPKAPLGGYAVTYRIMRPDGSLRHIRDQARPIRDASGAVVRVVGTASDVTDVHDAQQALLENMEHLRQAQKMEAIGRLAGGVAHDFNNLLTVILGFGEMASAEAGVDPALRSKLELMIAAGQRAAVLTQQLLAFSRKQVARPVPLDIDAVLRGTVQILSRVVGEDLTLRLDLCAGPGAVVADRGQIEQIAMNLVVNARDAMPDGGVVTIATRGVEFASAAAETRESDVGPGGYVEISVADTGTGMTPEVRARLFEPFFTTKEPGKGTGLGLATVYGIVRQAGGSVSVETAPGRGTTFRILLPRRPAPVPARRTTVGGSAPPRGDETVLLVEDEPTVRQLATVILESAGYRVLGEETGESAVRRAETETGRIDLVLTDVVMPGMNGKQTADRVRELHPECAVIYTSGYTDDVISRHGVLEPGIDLVEKPYTRDSLLRRVRRALDRPVAVESSAA